MEIEFQYLIYVKKNIEIIKFKVFFDLVNFWFRIGFLKLYDYCRKLDFILEIVEVYVCNIVEFNF